MCTQKVSFASPSIALYWSILQSHYTHLAASVTAPVRHRRSTLAPPALIFGAVGTRAGLPPVGIGLRA